MVRAFALAAVFLLTAGGCGLHLVVGPGERLLHLRGGPGVLSAHDANADQVLYNRIGTVFDNRVPTPRISGSILLWTDGVLDYYGAALNLADGDRLLQRAAASIRPGPKATFTLPALDPTLGLRFSGDPSGQWRSSEAAIAYGFTDASFGEIDITVTPAQPGFVEALLGPAAFPVHGRRGWLLRSQTSFNMGSYTLFWFQSPGVMVVLTSDGRVSEQGLLRFANSLQPVDQASWITLANRISSS